MIGHVAVYELPPVEEGDLPKLRGVTHVAVTSVRIFADHIEVHVTPGGSVEGAFRADEDIPPRRFVLPWERDEEAGEESPTFALDGIMEALWQRFCEERGVRVSAERK
jgi:hypothetical protein